MSRAALRYFSLCSVVICQHRDLYLAVKVHAPVHLLQKSLFIHSMASDEHPNTYPFYRKNIAYSNTKTKLQTLDICLTHPPLPQREQGFWVLCEARVSSTDLALLTIILGSSTEVPGVIRKLTPHS